MKQHILKFVYCTIQKKYCNKKLIMFNFKILIFNCINALNIMFNVNNFIDKQNKNDELIKYRDKNMHDVLVFHE